MQPGDELGPYEIVALLGKGGMGEVYRARDPRVGRDVAVKLSAERFSDRFEREARAIAALNHPNICTLFDVGPNYLVMELVDGEFPRGPLPLDEALGIATQIGAALEAAHDRGVVHRDLKPANIKVRPDGTVKVLDFGLAKHTPLPGEGDDTETMSLTQPGAIIGTVAYMSPEQAQGRPVDKRTDIWAFGVVLYGLLTGVEPFRGPTMPDTLAAVLREEPDWQRVPEKARRLLRRCLDKDPRRRLRDIGDMHLLLDDAPASPSRVHWTPWIAAAAAALSFIALWVWIATGRSREAQPIARFDVDLDQGSPSTYFYGPNAILSPDGTRLVFVAEGPDGTSRLYTRRLDQRASVELAGTEGAHSPFMSTDGQGVGFFAQGRMKRIAVDGGPVVTVADISNPRGGNVMQLRPGERVGQLIVEGGTYLRYLASGHLTYLRGATLFARKFNLDRLETEGREGSSVGLPDMDAAAGRVKRRVEGGGCSGTIRRDRQGVLPSGVLSGWTLDCVRFERIRPLRSARPTLSARIRRQLDRVGRRRLHARVVSERARVVLQDV